MIYAALNCYNSINRKTNKLQNVSDCTNKRPPQLTPGRFVFVWWYGWHTTT